jgi:ketosteroid isomerase-like protein
MSGIQERGSCRHAFSKVAVATLAPVLMVACAAAEPGELSDVERQTVVAEINERLNEYAAAVTSKNLDVALSFWSDSEEFIFAGDGTILGGYDEWAALTTQHTAETAQWLYWDWTRIEVAILSRSAASATVEFDFSSILNQGDTLSLQGAWTYVFKKFEGEWKVIQTNGHHLGL